MSCKTLLAGLLLLLIFRPGNAQNPSETRSYMKTFPSGKETSLEVTNKYGTIEVTTWNKDSVFIRAEIKAYASNQEKLSSMFEGISVNITGTGSILRAQTSFAQNFTRLFEGFKGMTGKIFSYDSRVEINYYINIPEYLNIKIDNRYGDLYMEDCTGKLSVVLSNGSFKAGNLGGEAELIFTFCDATIGSISSGKIEASFSEVSADRVGKISINSISSKYIITDAGEIHFESRRDKYSIDNITSVTGEAYFTDYTLNNLKKEIVLITKYGSINVESIDNGFDAINLNSGYSEIHLNFAETSSYNFDIRHINTFLSLPTKNIKTEVKTLNEEKKEYITFGKVGDNPGSVKVKLDAMRGRIYIK